MTDPEQNHGKNAPISCPFCGGCLTIEKESQEVVQCPFCGEKSLLSDLMGDSESVRNERKQQKAREEELRRYLKEEQEKFSAAESRINRLPGILKNIAVFLLVPLLGAILFRSFFLKFGDEVEKVLPAPEKTGEIAYWGPTIDWDSVMLKDHMPRPAKLYGTWRKIDENSVHVSLEQVDKSGFINYETRCREMGYEKESIPSAGWTAFDRAGYRMKLEYRELTDQLEVQLSAPIPLEPFSWDDYEAAQLVPVPDTDTGHVEPCVGKQLHVFVGGVDLEAFRNYCRLLKQEGFEKTDFPLYDFQGKDSRNFAVSANYYGNSIVELIISTEQVKIS